MLLHKIAVKNRLRVYKVLSIALHLKYAFSDFYYYNKTRDDQGRVHVH